jgi:hypothetical protein
VGLAPGDALGQQNAPHLTAPNLDTMLLRGFCQRIQGPMRRLLLVGLVLRA